MSGNGGHRAALKLAAGISVGQNAALPDLHKFSVIDPVANFAQSRRVGQGEGKIIQGFCQPGVDA